MKDESIEEMKQKLTDAYNHLRERGLRNDECQAWYYDMLRQLWDAGQEDCELVMPPWMAEKLGFETDFLPGGAKIKAACDEAGIDYGEATERFVQFIYRGMA